MFANGPACTNAGCPSSVCIRLGMIASFINTVAAPATPRSSTLTAAPVVLVPITARPIRSRRSSRLVVNARMAISSDATVMS